MLIHREALNQFPQEPLARYLLFLTHPEPKDFVRLTKSGGNRDGFLQRLMDLRVLRNRLANAQASKQDPAQRQADREHALKYVRRDRASSLGWAMLGLLQDEGGGGEDFQRRVAQAYRLFEEVPGLQYSARYEQARLLLKSGLARKARARFREAYTRRLVEGTVPEIDQSFREALRGIGQGPDEWTAWMQRTAATLVSGGRRPAAVALAWQCWELGDRPLADRLLGIALDRPRVDAERLEASLAAFEYLWHTSQYNRADQLIRSLLARAPFAEEPSLWRLALVLATERRQPSRTRACLERVVELESRRLPELIDIRAVRADFGLLLSAYQQMASALATIEAPPPEGFVDEVVQMADRWRNLDPDSTAICWTAGWILQTVGARELAWDYFTTALGQPSAGSGLWPDLASSLRDAGDRELADQACAAAFEAQPSNPWILCDRAMILQELGRPEEARRILRRIAEGPWPPEGEEVQRKAREYLESR
jgi:tetratricopeptide (TPR) repeat protein